MHHDPFLAPPPTGFARYRSNLLLLSLFAMLFVLVVAVGRVAGDEQGSTPPHLGAADAPTVDPTVLEVVYIDPETGELRPEPPVPLPIIDLTTRIPPPPRLRTSAADIEIAAATRRIGSTVGAP